MLEAAKRLAILGLSVLLAALEAMHHNIVCGEFCICPGSSLEDRSGAWTMVKVVSNSLW